MACLSESMDGELPDTVTVEEGMSPMSSTATRATSAGPRSTCAARRRWCDAALDLLETRAVPKEQIFYDKFTSPIFD